MKILVVLTGGTICSEYKGNVKVQGVNAATVLEKEFKDSDSPFAKEVEFVTTENYGIFSENMTVEKWNTLIDKLKNIPVFKSTAAAKGNYPSLKSNSFDEKDCVDGVIIAHGTDSLAYSSAMFSILLKNLGVPVFMVSSNEALSEKNANGVENFTAAVECICRGIAPGVYVTYRNSNGRMYLHLAKNLIQCGDYSEDFYSKGMAEISDCTGSAFKLLPMDNEENGVDIFTDFRLKNNVLKIEPYVGLNYDFFDFSSVKAVLHGTYHSGTVCAETDEAREDFRNSLIYLVKKYPEIPVYIAPSDISSGIYETVADILKISPENITFLTGETTEYYYARLLVKFSKIDSTTPARHEKVLSVKF